MARSVRVLVIGAGGMIGRKLAARLAYEGGVGTDDVAHMTLVDVEVPPLPASAASWCDSVAGDISDSNVAERLIAGRPDVVFHLAAIVSGEAEADFERGYAINLDGTRHLFEAIRRQSQAAPYCPRVVFASSLAVFGAPLPTLIPDDLALTPLTSYGTQKAICELLLADYSRRGFLDGVALRLPTICIRPGIPNRAASGFFSSILREPLVGLEAVLPVSDAVRHWFASPRAAVGFLLHAAALDTLLLENRRSLSLPGVLASVGEQIDALRRVAGEAAVGLIRREPNPTIAAIIAGWPQGCAPERAIRLGFRAEQNFDEIIRVHIEDELNGVIGPVA